MPMDVSDAPRHFGRRARMGRALSAVRGFTNALGAARDTLLPRAAAPIRSLGTARAFTTHAGRGTLPWTTRVDDVLVALKSTAVQNLLHRPQGVFTRGFAAEAGSLKVYKPTSPGQRGRITTTRDHLWKGKPFKALTVGLRKKGGRNNQGRIYSLAQGRRAQATVPRHRHEATRHHRRRDRAKDRVRPQPIHKNRPRR